MSAPAGWYPVPEGRERYWDGSAWTEQMRDLAAPATGPALDPTPEPTDHLDQSTLDPTRAIDDGGNWSSGDATQQLSVDATSVLPQGVAEEVAAAGAGQRLDPSI